MLKFVTSYILLISAPIISLLFGAKQDKGSTKKTGVEPDVLLVQWNSDGVFLLVK